MEVTGAGAVGNGCRTVPLSFKTTVELIQVIGQTSIIDGVGGFRLLVGDLPKPFPDRRRVVG